MTEAQILNLLHRRYGAVSMGARRFAVAEHVPVSVPWATRIADFIAQDCHSGHLFHGHEIKVSRSDWLRELADPTKAEGWSKYCDQWWLVAPPGVVRDDLPDGWGLLIAYPTTLRCVVPASKLTPAPMPVRTRAALLRSVQATARRRAAGDSR